MQLSFPSVPSDPSSASPIPGLSASGDNGAAAAVSSSPTDGFAQLLAGVDAGTSSTGAAITPGLENPAVLPTLFVPGMALTAMPQITLQGAPNVIAPVPANGATPPAVGTTPNGDDAAVAGDTSMLVTPGNPGFAALAGRASRRFFTVAPAPTPATTGVGAESAPVTGGEKKSLAEQGDIQAAAMAAAQPMVVAVPVAQPTDQAVTDTGVDAAGSDPKMSTGIGAAALTFRPAFTRQGVVEDGVAMTTVPMANPNVTQQTPGAEDAEPATSEVEAEGLGAALPETGDQTGVPAGRSGTNLGKDFGQMIASAARNSTLGQNVQTTSAVTPASRLVQGASAVARVDTPAQSPGSAPVAVSGSTGTDIELGDDLPAQRVPATGENGSAIPSAMQTSTAQPEAAAPNATEKFADVADSMSVRSKRGISAPAKSFVPAEKKEVTSLDPTLGIGTAKNEGTMPYGSTFARSTGSDTQAVPSTGSTAEARQTAESLPPQVTLASTAHRAVEAILNVTERFSARDQHSVNLQFSVGGSDLNVRVELRAGEVRTTFRTDSAELRNALANEWQSVANQSGADRSVRLAPPVFATSDAAGMSYSGQDTPRQRDQGASNGSQSFAGTFLPRQATSGTTTTAPTGAANPTRTISGNSVHLHTLA